MKLRLLLFAVFLCFYGEVFSETFVVTSNADAGAGTLREAISKANANGISEIDYIHFNLPGATENDRTILLASSLPSLTSKIVIDGTTQPSADIGNSHARIILKTLRSFDKPDIILFSAKNVEQLEFYGIYFHDTTDPTLSYAGDVKRAIDIFNGKNIVIGDKNKGNVFTGYRGYWGSVAIEKTDGLKIGDNFLGLSPYGPNSIPTEPVVLKDVNNIEIGGTDKRNVIFTGFNLDFTDRSTLFNVNINNNNVLVHQDGVTTEWSISSTVFRIHGSMINLDDPQSKINLNVSDNLFSHYTGSGAIELLYLAGSVKIWHNWFGIDRSNTIPLGNKNPHGSVGVPVSISVMNAEIIFGNEDPALGNIVAYSGSGIAVGYRSPAVKIIRNSFRCFSGKAIAYNNNTIPFVEVTEKNPAYIKGKSTPLAIVDAFLGDDCKGCLPQTYIGTTNADANGDWQFNFSATYARNVLVNAHVGKQSSEFSFPLINTVNVKVVDADCSTTGEIKGIIISNTDKLRWVNEKGETVSTERELKNVLPGKYKLIIGEFCTTESEYFTIRDLNPIINSSNVNKKQPTCGLSDGSITNLFAYTIDGSPVSYTWTNQNAQVISNTRDATNLPSGSYTLTVKTAKCSASYGPVILKSPNSPVIDLAGLVKISSVCGQATGSVTNISITATGNVNYVWKNGNGEIVGNEKDLKNIPGGIYTLQITDGGGCGSVFSEPVEVPEINGITINTANKLIDKATCNTSNGSITGIAVTGATGYKWLDAGGTTVATALNLTGMPAGKYRLVASNAVCSKTSEELLIELAQTTKDYATTKISTSATCNLNNGKIEAIFTKDQPASCFWKNDAGQVVGNSRILENQGPGAYNFYAIDDLGCEHFLQQYSIGNLAGASINRGLEQISKDQCGLGKGQIKAPGLSGGQQPYFYEWKDINGRVLGSGAILDGIKAGDYQLTIGDALACSRQTISYTVESESSTLPVPVINDVKICSGGNAVIQVLQPQEGTYLLYGTDGALMGQNATGMFNVTVKESQSFSIALRKGSCESPAASAKVTIENDGLGDLANAFSPNGDGQNDQWMIPGMQNYPEATVAIYNRYGHKVFESTGYKEPFNGRQKGTELPVGVYYYIIDLKRACGLQKGSLMLVK
jgi:gliding motility-associated-like protein